MMKRFCDVAAHAPNKNVYRNFVNSKCYDEVANVHLGL